MTKILEKVINNRLIWYLEKSEILSKHQSKFRKSRYTINNLIMIKDEMNSTFEVKQYLGYLDITKAYDSI